RKRRYFESAIRDAIANGSIEPCDPVQKAQSIEFLVQGALSQARILNNAELLRDLPATALQMLRPKAAVTAGAAR
ncbi:MAG TPA: hypothetical protein VMD31_03020, partial [Opitutaceae bacterium]|nr:hypothetical protein [Opitutaceae bacterium]